MAILSIWDALGAEGSGVVRFGGEGTGWSCRIPYLWDAGHTYRLRLLASGPGWWEASVADGDDDATSIGRVHVPEHWGRLARWSVMWTEYYGGPLSRCDELAHSRVVFGMPVADGGMVRPARQEDHYGPGTCDTSSIEPVPGGVRHEMGGPGTRSRR